MINFLKIITTGFVAAYIAFVGAFHDGTPQTINTNSQATTSAVVATVPPPVRITTAPAIVAPKTTTEKQSTTQTSSQGTANITPVTIKPVAATVTPSPQPSQPVQATVAVTNSASACPAIENDFYNSVYKVSVPEGQVSTLLQSINAAVNSENQVVKNQGSISAAYQVYLSADDSINAQMSAISTAVASINSNTTYEDNVNLKTAGADLLSAAADYDAFYKGTRLAVATLATLASAPLNDSLAEETFTDDWDAAEDQYQQGAIEYGLATTTLATLLSEDSSTKIKNGCNSSGLQVYSDIANKEGNGLTCAQDGYTTGLDATMCQLYDEGSVQFRSNGEWAIISRPTQ